MVRGLINLAGPHGCCSFQGDNMPRYYEGKYVGNDQRRATEDSDRGILPSDRGIANMPQSAVYKPWSGSPELTPINAPEGLNDTREGIDQQIMEDLGMKKAPGGGSAEAPAAPAAPAAPEAVTAPATPAPVKAALEASAAPAAATAIAAKEVEEKAKLENPKPF